MLIRVPSMPGSSVVLPTVEVLSSHSLSRLCHGRGVRASQHLGCGNRGSKTSSALTTRSPPGIAAAKQLRRVVFPACVPPATRTFRPARTDASRKAAAWAQRAELDQLVQPGGGEDELADVDRRPAPADALEDDVEPVALRQHRVDEGAADVDPPAEDLSIRSTSSCTWALVSIRLVSSWRPRRAMNTRLGSLIQTSSTVGSSRKGCSGPKPETRATSRRPSSRHR